MPRPAQDAAPTRPVHKRRSSGRGQLLAAGLGLLFLAGLAWLIASVIGGPEGPRKPAVQQVAILRQQPPPPPPKPPERPPEPPKVQEEVKINDPQPEPVPDKPADPAPATQPLGLDADGSAGSDGFGLAANKGGRDITTIGGGGGGGGSGRYFTGLLQRNFFEMLARNRRAPQDEFSVVVRVWIGDDGRVQRARIVEGSGNAELDQLIETTLSEMSPLREVPPVNLRQVQLRLNRRA